MLNHVYFERSLFFIENSKCTVCVLQCQNDTKVFTTKVLIFPKGHGVFCQINFALTHWIKSFDFLLLLSIIMCFNKLLMIQQENNFNLENMQQSNQNPHPSAISKKLNLSTNDKLVVWRSFIVVIIIFLRNKMSACQIFLVSMSF